MFNVFESQISVDDCEQLAVEWILRGTQTRFYFGEYILKDVANFEV